MRRRIPPVGSCVPYPTVTLAQAHDKAREARDKIERGIDPTLERKEAKARLIAARRKGLTFAEAIDKALGAKLDAFKNEKQRDQATRGKSPKSPLRTGGLLPVSWTRR